MIAPEVFTFSNTSSLARAAAETIVETLRAAISKRGRAVLMLTGGGTPRTLYQLLAADYGHALDWTAVDIFFSDERHVPHDDADSNFRMARETLLDGLSISPEHVFPFPTAGTPTADARAYEQTLRAYFGDAPGFDLALLGMGEDGHVASLFPAGPELDETERWAIATEAPAGNPARDRLSLTFPLLNAAHTVLFLVAGEKKRDALAAVLQDPDRSPPAERVTARERMLWYTDTAAAGSNRKEDLS